MNGYALVWGIAHFWARNEFKQKSKVKKLVRGIPCKDHESHLF